MKKLNKFGFSVIELLLIILVIGLLIGIGYSVYQRGHKTDTPSPATSSESQTKTLDDIITEVKEEISKKQSDVVKINEIKQDEYAGYIHYSVPNYNYKVTMSGKQYVNYELINPKIVSVDSNDENAYQQAHIEDLATSSDVSNNIKKILQKENFKEDTSFKNEEFYDKNSSTWVSDVSVCVIAPNMSPKFVCTTKQELAKEAAKVKPFVDAYPTREKEMFSEGLSYGLVTTGTGKTKNDKYANVSVGNAGAYFYWKDNKWVFIASSQEGINCDQPEVTSKTGAIDAVINICRKPGEGL